VVGGAADRGEGEEVIAAFALALLAANGSVEGTVLFDGATPVPKKIVATTDTAICSQQDLVDESVLVDPKTKGIANVVVWVEGVRGKKRTETVNVDNFRCRYEPHVAIADVGQPILVRNKDRFLHTSQAKEKAGKTIFNIALPFKDAEKQQSFAKRGPFQVVCDVHSWMNGWVVVLEGEPAAITDASGNFEIADVPPGKQKLVFWHETLGEKTLALEVKPGEPLRDVELKFSAKK
jgi:plastocyanin